MSLGPSGGGCDTGNVAIPVGLLGLALVVGLFTWDALRQRRRLQLRGMHPVLVGGGGAGPGGGAPEGGGAAGRGLRPIG